jgi:hypothetical protein
MKFEYAELEKRNRHMTTTYLFEGAKFDYLMDALTYVGERGWELIGQIDGRLVLKRKK